MFDKPSQPKPADASDAEKRSVGPEDERIALRCTRRELQLLDTFVVSGEFRNRSQLMREALRAFLRSRAESAPTSSVAPDAEGLIEVPVRLRPEEIEAYAAFGQLVGNGRTVADVVAELARRGELELKVSELVRAKRQLVHEAAEARAQLGALRRSGEDLERKGVVGR